MYIHDAGYLLQWWLTCTILLANCVGLQCLSWGAFAIMSVCLCVCVLGTWALWALPSGQCHLKLWEKTWNMESLCLRLAESSLVMLLCWGQGTKHLYGMSSWRIKQSSPRFEARLQESRCSCVVFPKPKRSHHLISLFPSNYYHFNR